MWILLLILAPSILLAIMMLGKSVTDLNAVHRFPSDCGKCGYLKDACGCGGVVDDDEDTMFDE